MNKIIENKIETLIEEGALDFAKRNAVPLGLGAATLGTLAYGLDQDIESDQALARLPDMQTSLDNANERYDSSLKRSNDDYELKNDTYPLNGERYGSTHERHFKLLDQARDDRNLSNDDLYDKDVAGRLDYADVHHSRVTEAQKQVDAIQNIENKTPSDNYRLAELQKMIKDDQRTVDHYNNSLAEERTDNDAYDKAVKQLRTEAIGRYHRMYDRAHEVDALHKEALADRTPKDMQKYTDQVTKDYEKSGIEKLEKNITSTISDSNDNSQNAEKAGVGAGVLGASALGSALYNKLRNKK